MYKEEYFMSVALIASKLSQDPNTKVGACLVSNDNKIISTGYNSFLDEGIEGYFPMSREGEFHKTKYAYVFHAEENCIIGKDFNITNGGTIYTTLYPCNNCAKLIINTGIKRVIYLEHKYKNDPIFLASRILFDYSGIIVTKFESPERLLNYVK